MKKTLTTLLSALCLIASAQTVDLTQTYGITWKDTLTLGKRYTYAQAKAKYPAWVGYMEYTGKSSTVLNVREFAAAHNDAVWANDDAIGVVNYANGCGSRCNVNWPAGVFRVDIELLQPQGAITGQGTQGWKLDSWPMKPGGTTLIYDRAGWDGDKDKRYLIRDMTWGKVDNFGYTEGAQLHQVKILGGGTGLYDPTQHFSAIGAWKRGEVSTISDVFVYECNDYAIELRGEFHATFETSRVSCFLNGRAGIGIIGGGHVQGYMLSFDDNPACFEAIPDEKGSIGNGTTISVDGIKFETGKTAGRPYSRGQRLLIGEGWVQFFCSGLTFSRVNSVPHSLIEIKPTDNISFVQLVGTSWFSKPYALLHDRTAKTLTLMDEGEYQGRVNDFYWRSDVGVVSSSGVALKVIPQTCDGMLAPLERDPMTGQAKGTWSGCQPAFSHTQPVAWEGGPVIPPPDPCKCGEWGPWGECKDNVQTRIRVCTGNCIGDETKQTQDCGAPPSNIKFSGGPWDVNSSTYWIPLEITKVSKATIIFSPRSLNYGRILGTGKGLPSLAIYPDGYLYFDGKRVSNKKSIIGKKNTIIAKLPEINVIGLFQTDPSQGGACQGLYDQIILE